MNTTKFGNFRFMSFLFIYFLPLWGVYSVVFTIVSAWSNNFHKFDKPDEWVSFFIFIFLIMSVIGFFYVCRLSYNQIRFYIYDCVVDFFYSNYESNIKNKKSIITINKNNKGELKELYLIDRDRAFMIYGNSFFKNDEIPINIQEYDLEIKKEIFSNKLLCLEVEKIKKNPIFHIMKLFFNYEAYIFYLKCGDRINVLYRNVNKNNTDKYNNMTIKSYFFYLLKKEDFNSKNGVLMSYDDYESVEELLSCTLITSKDNYQKLTKKGILFF